LYTFNITNALSFDKSFGDHNLGIQAIQESYQMELSAFDAQGTGFLPNVRVLNGSTTPEAVGGYVTKDRLSSYLGRATYNCQEKYYFEASYRTDGSTRFGQDVRWGDFYSVGAAWVASEESFMESIPAVSFLKLKASIGELGNNQPTNPLSVGANDLGYFPYLQLFETGWNQGPFTGVILGSVADPRLTWEKTRSTNFGVELRFLNDRFGANIEYYNRESVDLIYDKPLAPSTGNTSITTNVGAVKNYGLEVTLSSTNIQKPNVLWTTSLNFSRDRNEITELTQESFISGTKRWEVGRSLYEFYIQDWAGVNPENGRGRWWKDVIGPDGEPTGERTTTELYSEATRYYVGKSSLPDMIGGLSNYVRYRNFDLNILFSFSVGSYIYDSQYARLMNGFETPGDGAASVDIKKRWQKPGDYTDVPLLLASNNDFNTTSSRFLFKNDYLRLRALNFGYNFPRQITERLDIQRLRLYFQGDNLLTLLSHKGLDPEQSFAGTTDNRSYNQKIVSLGLNLTF
jgi:TonB-linked SusC/RagA family outer membrane protein